MSVLRHVMLPLVACMLRMLGHVTPVCNKCYDEAFMSNFPGGIFTGDIWGFCNCCPQALDTAIPDDPIPEKEPLKGPSIDKEDPQIQKIKKLAGIKPKEKDEPKEA